MNFNDAYPGDREGLDELFSVTYEELRRLAASIGGPSSGFTLNPTALVNEAWLKLKRSRTLDIKSELHFKRLAARAMRQVLVDAARHRNSQKCGGQDLVVIAIDNSLEVGIAPEQGVLALNDVLTELESLDPRQAALVESRFFAGLDVAETAELLEMSPITVQREWRAARAWLKVKLRSC